MANNKQDKEVRLSFHLFTGKDRKGSKNMWNPLE